MDYRFYLVKAQEADALADAAISLLAKHTWEQVAQEYRKTALLLAKQLKVKTHRCDL